MKKGKSRISRQSDETRRRVRDLARRKSKFILDGFREIIEGQVEVFSEAVMLFFEKYLSDPGKVELYFPALFLPGSGPEEDVPPDNLLTLHLSFFNAGDVEVLKRDLTLRELLYQDWTGMRSRTDYLANLSAMGGELRKLADEIDESLKNERSLNRTARRARKG